MSRLLRIASMSPTTKNAVVWAGSVSPYQWRLMVVGEKKLVDVLTDSPRGLPLEQAVPSLLRCLGFMED